MTEFYGYERPDGSVGVRNHHLVVPTAVVLGHSHSALDLSRYLLGRFVAAVHRGQDEEVVADPH